MKVKIITRHAPTNYGSLLQSIATIRIFKKEGYESQIIDYIRDDERGLQQNLCYLKNNKFWNSSIFTKILFVMLRLPEEIYAEKVFDKYRANYLSLTKRYNNIHSLKQEQADVFCTGSDQVWGNVITGHYDPAYFLKFVSDDVKKIAFSASFGRTDFEDKILNEYKHFLCRYSAISVRESQAVELLDKMGIDCAGHILDPTLFLTGKEWSSFIHKEIKDKYVLIYQVHNDKDINIYAKEFARLHNLKLIRISPYFHHITRGGKFIYLPNISTFLSYFKNCQYLITDSFHGTSFALNFNKQFQVILCKDNTGSRIRSLLQLTNLQCRLTTNLEDFDSIYNDKINYKMVNDILSDERKKSNEILSTLLKK